MSLFKFSRYMGSVLALSLLGSLVACSDNSSSGNDDPKLSAEQQDRVDSLFATPTTAEKSAVLQTFGSLDRAAISTQVEYADTFALKNKTELVLHVVSHVSGGNKHFGAILFPSQAQAALPVLLFCHWGDRGINVDTDLTRILNYAGDLAQSFMIVIPSFRSEPLYYKDNLEWRSEGNPSPWEGDVHDALRLVSAAETLSVKAEIPALNVSKMRAMGFSRGGGVALLASLYDPRIERVVDYFGPTDFFGTFVQDVVTDLFLGEIAELPGVSYLDTALVQKLIRAELSMDSLRNALLVRSPARFASKLPPVMIHHGSLDDIVPVSQSNALRDAMMAENPTQWAKSSLTVYQGAGHDPLPMIGKLGETVAFLLEGLPNVALTRKSVEPISPPNDWVWETPGFYHP